jgi:hypothetical protein
MSPQEASAWEPEPELKIAVEPPRTVALKGSWYLHSLFIPGLIFFAAVSVYPAQDGGVIVGSVFLCVAVIIFVTQQWKRRQSKLIVTNGIVARGVIVAVYARNGGEDGEVSYDCCIAYSAAGGDHGVTIKDRSKGEIGDVLTMLYLPDRPSTALPYQDCVHLVKL